MYLGRIAVLSWAKGPTWKRTAVAAAALITLGQYCSLSALTIFELKNVIHGKAELASVVKAHTIPGRIPSLFFPFADGYRAMEFIAYLNYRGLPINYVSLESGASTKDAPCVDYRTVICHPVSGPSPGDLVIVLPDDVASRAQAEVYRAGAELLLSYEPRPSIARWLYPFVTVPLATDSQKPRPDRWMHASVALWKRSVAPASISANSVLVLPGLGRR
jgi:hypothetical protein